MPKIIANSTKNDIIEKEKNNQEDVLKMNKQDLIAAVAAKAGLTKKDAETAVNGFIASVESALASGDKVQLIGFGTFEVKERAAREGRNPRNPEETVAIPASKAPVFKVVNALKDAVNK